MSSLYVLEPPTKGKVIVITTHGPIDVELWPQEAPKSVQNFVQLCLEGYFDNTIFHRVIPRFLVQGGDPTGSGTGGDSIYGVTGDSIYNLLRLGEVDTGTPKEAEEKRVIFKWDCLFFVYEALSKEYDFR